MLVTPTTLESGYEFLKTLKPFQSWKLPDSDSVEFHVIKAKGVMGEFLAPNSIRVSAHSCRSIETTLMTLAHEMIHLYQHIKGTETRGEHNAEFHRIADRVCKIHLWDRGVF